jgi:DNA-binding transcriptional LysR family regulator
MMKSNARLDVIPNKFNLDLLIHFDTLMRERHVSRAAVALGIGQPAVSSALAKLRDAFQDPLLVRTAQGMVPTNRALELEGQVHEMMETVRKMFAPAHETVDLRDMRANIHISTAHGSALLFMPPLMANLRQHAPGLQISVMPRDHRKLVQLLESGELDIALDIMRTPPQLLRCARLYPQHVRCIVSSNHPVIKDTLSLEEFVAFPHVLWDSEPVKFPVMEQLVNSALRQKGLTRTAGIRVASATMAPAIAAATDMIAIVSDRLAYESAKSLPLIVLKPPLNLAPIDFSMFWHERTQQDPARLYVRKVIRDIATSMRHGMTMAAWSRRGTTEEHA